MFLLTTFLTWTPPTLPAQILNACEVTSTSRPRIRFLQCSSKGLLNECMVAPLPYEAFPVGPLKFYLGHGLNSLISKTVVRSTFT